MSWKGQILSAILAAAGVIAVAWLGGTKALGAHHFWSVKVALIGAPIGAILALATARLPRLPAIAGFTVLTLAAFAAAKWGQTEFANSYAENQLAGKFWYFGWIAAALALTTTASKLMGMIGRTE